VGREFAHGEQEAARLIDAGNLDEDAGRLLEALAAYDAAVHAAPGYARAHVNRGNALAALGRHDEAFAAYDQALARDPGYAGAHVNIGNLHLRLDHAEEAIGSYRRAIEIDPCASRVHLALGMTLQQLGRLDEAIAAFRASIDADAGSVAAHTNLGNVLIQRERLAEAVGCFRAATEIAPDTAEVWGNLGSVLSRLGRYEEAVDAFLVAVKLKPELALAHNELGNALRECGRSHEAIASFRRAIEIEADHFAAHTNLGLALRDVGQISSARAPFERALQLRPRDARARTGLGCVLHELGLLDEAIEHHRKALEVDETYVEVRNNLANALKDSGRLDDAVDEYKRVIRERPKFWSAHNNLLLTMNFTGGDPLAYLEVANSFGRALKAATPPPFVSWSAAPRPKRLRVGLVSGDLRGHPVGYFLEGFLAHAQDTRLDLIAYPTYAAQDELTARIRPAFSAWKPLVGLSDEAAASLIRDDGVHILIDLAGHTGHNRLPIFAWKPAPLQVGWLGYFASTGVIGMDYVIGDPIVAPPSEAAHFTETLWRLPDCYLCFTPPAVSIDVSPLPALASGHVTFGCFNNLAKVNDDVVRLWTRVVLEVPNARLLLKAVQLADEEMRERTRRRFEVAGMPRNRLVLEAPSARAQFLTAYHRVDIALDPFPFPGGTTTAEAYWMGVPTLTRKGDRFLARAGESFARAAGMADWIADDDKAYVAKAVAFATDLTRLAGIRAGLRSQVLASPLFDAQRYARAVDAALWGMWDSYAKKAR
jgi:predicted O-linked N-acetylglucosamine transferase (SPINDLY family)